jgi:hypothetical protein
MSQTENIVRQTSQTATCFQQTSQLITHPAEKYRGSRISPKLILKTSGTFFTFLVEVSTGFPEVHLRPPPYSRTRTAVVVSKP